MSELTDEETEAFVAELESAMGAYTTFMTSLGANADLDSAIEDFYLLFFVGEDGYDEENPPYFVWLFG